LNKDFWKKLDKPIIGLSPMHGYTDSAFRQLCKYINNSIVTFTEFVSADGLAHNSKKSLEKLFFSKAEQPIIAQIFGKAPESFSKAAKICEDLGFSGIDINMGCPAKKVVKSGHGLALRKNPDLALQLIEVLANSTKLPVSVKTRLGWDNANDLMTFAKSAENAGANMIAVHARTFHKPYSSVPNWEPIYELKNNINIPILGNGGVLNIDDGLNKCKKLDGFLIGQASFGNPWIFSSNPLELTFKDKIPCIKKHSDWLVQTKGETKACNEIRKHLLRYSKGYVQAKQLRAKFVQVQSLAEIFEILDCIPN
jgi:tRNA-dihydrouridine synthase B